MKVNVESVAARVPAMLYVYTVDHETGESSFPYVSDYCEAMFGFPAALVMEDPKRLVNCILEDEAEEYAAAVMESMEQLSPFDRRGRMRRADGEIINVHYKSMPRLETNEEGCQLTVWDGVVFDVTNQVRNEQEDRNKMKELMDESLQPMFEVDTQGCVTEWNKAMACITGLSQQEVVGEPVVEFMPKEERGSFVSRTVNEDESQLDCVFITKEAKKVYLHAACTIRRDANGSSKGQLFCCHDVTTVREAEQQKDEALELANAERGLTEWLSHEVRNPLSVAMEAAITLKEGGDESISCIDLISESIRYIIDLLTNMLDLNKCLEGKISLYPAPCRLREEILVPTCKMMSIRDGQVELQLTGGEEVVAAVDKLRLRQVVTNLVSNALKFTTKGYVRVDLQQKPVSQKVRNIRISVSDSGCGVQPKDYVALFSKWEQLGSKMNGTGIGLCLSKALVNAMGGNIYLDKGYSSGIQDHPGSRFVIDLPVTLTPGVNGESTRMPAFESLSAAVLASRASPDLESNSLNSPENADLYLSVDSPQTTKPSTTSIRGNFKVLVVDDDKMGRKLLRRRFSRLFPDADIDEVASGEESLVKAEETNYDVITVDHFMAVGEMSGEDTIKALRAKGSDALIIGISGNWKEKEHLAAGAEDFFQKPIPSDEIMVSRLINKMSPPSNWKVLCVDDVEVNIHFLCRRLRKVSAPHFTSLEAAEKRWSITSKMTGEEAVDVLRNEWFDLVILDHYLGDGMDGISVAEFVREGSVNKDAVVVLNSGSTACLPRSEGRPYDIVWPKPLPSNEQMRFDLCVELLKSSDGR